MQDLSGCPKCGYGFDGMDNFCQGCGYDLRPHQIKLPCCGMVFIPRANGANKFCPFCGSPRETATQQKELV